MRISDEAYNFLLKKQGEAMRRMHFGEALLFNGKLYEETLHRYHELCTEYEKSIEFNSKQLGNRDPKLRELIKMLNELSEMGMTFKFLDSQSENKSEGEQQ